MGVSAQVRTVQVESSLWTPLGGPFVGATGKVRIMLANRFRTLVAGAALTALTFSMATLTASPASADPSSPDSSLSSLSVTGPSMSSLAPGFSSATHDYQAVASDNSPATITPTTTDGNATFVVTSGSTVIPLTAGSADVPVTRGRNDIVVTVTSNDLTTTTIYRITVWRLAAPTSSIVSIADATSTVFGGTYMTVTLANGQLPGWNGNGYCDRSYSFGNNSGYQENTTFDPATGLTKDSVYVPPASDRAGGKVDLTVTNHCFSYSYGNLQSVTTSPDAVTYTPGYPVDSADAPATITSGSHITLHGTNIAAYSNAKYWIDDAQGNSQQIYTWYWTGNDISQLYVDYPWGSDWYKGSGPRTFHVGYCPIGQWQIDANCTIVYTKAINWVAPAPTDVSFTPSSGPVAGGTKIRLRGRFIVSGEESSTIKVGDQDVSSWTRISEADNTNNFDDYTQGQDIIEFLAPPSTATGPVPITVTNSIGTTVARGTFTYSAKPTITSIAPASVANTGGSVITVQGTAFGTSGRPTVIINGVKSPYVTRVSATQLTAIVPAATGTTGPVDVSVSSPQGGGVSAASTLNLVAPTTLPTVTKITPTSGHAGDAATLTGTGFGPSGTVGVSVDGQWALVTASSSTSISIEIPATDTTGAKDVVVGATTGAVTKTNGFTVLPDDGIITVSPAIVPSYATGNAKTIALSGFGFGTTGTVKVGAATAVAYTATGSGTQIAGVVVPTTAAASLPIVVTPTGSTTPLRSSVRVSGPVATYVGPDPHQAVNGPGNSDTGIGGVVADVPTTGGTAMRIEGTGFGTSGALMLASTTVTTLTWTDTAITFTAPAHAVGSLAMTVTPANSTLSVVRDPAVTYVAATAGQPTIDRIASDVDHGRNDRNEFDPANDVSDAFTLTGTNLAGNTPSTTRVIISGAESETFTVVPSSVTATSLTFAAPRGFHNGGWKNVKVVTDVASDSVSHGMWYTSAGVQLGVSPNSGLCLTSDTPASGPMTYNPAVVTITNSGTLFGESGTVTIDGTEVTPTSYADNQVVIDMTDLAADLAQPWGGKTILITPDDTSMPAQRVGFTCGVTPSVTTTANGSTDPLTVPAGTAYALAFTHTGFIGASPITATAPGDYEYVTAADFGSTDFRNNVHAGAPVAAGDYYVRVALSRASYDRAPYLGFTPAPVHVTITGTPVTIATVSNNGANITYKGQLDDASPADFHYTATSTTDPITKVFWQYRDSQCETQADSTGWIDGLPKNVALSSPGCGGDGVTKSSWDVRVKSFEMTTTGTDRSIYYQATTPTTPITINPRNLTVAAVRADRIYDGTTTATLGDLTVTGAVDGDDISLANGSGGGTFADGAPGVNKPVTLSQDLVLAGSAKGNYHLTNPQPTILGTITKASAVLSLAASPTSVLLSQHTPVTITTTLRDTRNNAVVADSANAAPVFLTSETPSVCTVSGTQVTAVAAGTCVIDGTEASSTNYNAATAASDENSTTETVEIQVFPAPQAISVVADDVTVAVGDTIDPTSQVSGLFDGDSVDNLDYDYYSGSTLLPGAPTDPGTYKVVPKGGTLNAANADAYSNPTSFTYVSGTLVITALPPTITTISPATGPPAGGTSVTITGTRLDTVKSVRIGGVTLRAGDFTVNDAGTTLTFITPRVSGDQVVDLTLVAGTATAADVFTYVTPIGTKPGAPTHLNAVGHDQKIGLTFTPPASTGGGITSYQVSTDGGHTWHAVTTKAGPNGTRTATVAGVQNGVTYSVKVRAVSSGGAGPASGADSALPNAPRLGNAKPVKASEVPVPKHPKAYHGKKKYTKARNTSHNGTWAHSIRKIGSRQLTIGEAATLSNSGLFGFDSAVLTNVGRAEVKTLAHHLRLAHGVSCEGYTDYAGDAKHEKSLSAQRANAVCRALIHYGAHVTFTKHGYGGARPVVIGGTPQSRAANRRVVVIVTK
jgi:outer membrane protein OmpA-like peptidoglycan-associated protein